MIFSLMISHDPLTTWSRVITWLIKSLISPLPNIQFTVKSRISQKIESLRNDACVKYLHKSYGNHMASDKGLICGLGGNAKTTVTNEMSYIYWYEILPWTVSLSLRKCANNFRIRIAWKLRQLQLGWRELLCFRILYFGYFTI